jgi:outer membrane protein assembly factor BamD
MARARRSLLPILVGAAVACAPTFQIRKFAGNPAALYAASLREFTQHHWDNAVTGFERLTLDLPARDSLLTRSHYYLGRSYEGRHEYLLAAQAFSRLSESFPNDTLADDAMYLAGRDYARLWRKPELDEGYGVTAATTLRTMLALYPDTPVRDSATAELLHLDEWMATKDYETGMHYYRRKAYDSAVIYFKDVFDKYPHTDHGREAGLRLVTVYRLPVMHYIEDANDVCDSLRTRYPGNGDVVKQCGTATASNTAPRPGAPPSPRPDR